MLLSYLTAYSCTTQTNSFEQRLLIFTVNVAPNNVECQSVQAVLLHTTQRLSSITVLFFLILNFTKTTASIIL